MNSNTNKYLTCLISVILAEGIGIVSGILTSDSVSIYTNLIKPTFAPSPVIFGIVWPILYLLMGIAACIVYNEGLQKAEVKSSLLFYVSQLLINFIWPIVFFNLQQTGLAFIIILILIVLVYITTIKFYNINKVAGLLMIPYLLWIIFAAILNLSIFILNY